MPNKVMFTNDEKEMLLPYNSFTQMVYVLGIKFSCDWWGVCRNDILELTTTINPDSVIDSERIQKSLDELHSTGLIDYLGSNDDLIVVKDFGKVNEFGFLKTNHSKRSNGSESNWVIWIKRAIKSGELEPYFLEIPSILMAKKEQFIKNFLNGTLTEMTYYDKKRKIERNYYESLMYKDIYHWYHDESRVDDVKEGELNDKPF
jgi:hypothetical protein|tara:strand:- start:309 stop:917 length:609 start_codon:yes stop_codon:yes gene_type:complete